MKTTSPLQTSGLFFLTSLCQKKQATSTPRHQEAPRGMTFFASWPSIRFLSNIMNR